MNKPKKSATLLKTILLSIIALVFALCIYIYVSIEEFDKDAAAQLASQALGVPVSIEEFDLSLETKIAKLTNVKIANPSGFAQNYALTIPAIEFSLGKITPLHIHIDKISMNNAVINLEVLKNNTNHGMITESLSHKGLANGGLAMAKLAKNYDQSMKISVNSLIINGAQLVPTKTLSQTKKFKPVTIPDITIGISKPEEGFTPAQTMSVSYELFNQALTQKAYLSGFLDGMDGVIDIETHKKIQAGAQFADEFIGNLPKATEKVKKDLGDFSQGIKKLWSDTTSGTTESLPADKTAPAPAGQ